MAVTFKTFRQNYPEFENADRFPDGAITYYKTIAGLLLNANRFQDMLDVATELFIAHNISIERRAQDEALRGGQPGVTTGPVTSKSVGPISVSYSVDAGIQLGAGHWNTTIYGLRFAELVSIFGAGPVQVNIGCGPSYSGPAWYGPWQGPWP